MHLTAIYDFEKVLLHRNSKYLILYCTGCFKIRAPLNYRTKWNNKEQLYKFRRGFYLCIFTKSLLFFGPSLACLIPCIFEEHNLTNLKKGRQSKFIFPFTSLTNRCGSMRITWLTIVVFYMPSNTIVWDDYPAWFYEDLDQRCWECTGISRFTKFVNPSNFVQIISYVDLSNSDTQYENYRKLKWKIA